MIGKGQASVEMWAGAGISGEALVTQEMEVEGGVFVANQAGDDLAGDGSEGLADHGVAGGDDQVFPVWGAADDGEAVGGAGSESAPNLEEFELVDAFEVVGGGALHGVDPAAIDGEVHAGHLEGAGQAEEGSHGSDGDAGLHEQQGDVGERVGAVEGEAVTLGGLDGQFEAQIAGDAGGPGTGGKDDLGGAKFAASGIDGGDAAAGGGEAKGLGALQEGGPGGFGQASETGDEGVGVHLGVFGEANATGGAGPQPGDDFAYSVLVEELGGEARILEETGLFAGFVEAGVGTEDVKEAVAGVGAIHAVEGGPLVVKIAAGEVEGAEKRDGGAGLLFVGGGPEMP